jgi:DNA-binding NarL/FixJ family response regulator
MTKKRVLIVDDHQLIRRGVAAVLSECPDWEVCGETSSGREAVAAATELKPDVVIMDSCMSDMNGSDATRQILKNNPGTAIVILSAEDSEHVIREVLASGALGYVLKSDGSDDLRMALEEVHQNRLFFTPRVGEIILQGYRGDPTADDQPEAGVSGPLSSREQEVLRSVAEGKSSKETATALNIAEKTVEGHRARIMSKLDLHSISDLVRYAIRNNIIEC